MDCTLQIFLDDRWVDFAPMYLDPELIPRVLRWYRPDTRVDLTDWADVLAALPVPDRERRMLALALSRFAAQIERLPDIMEAQGVDHDIIEFLAQSIDTQVRQLKALQSPEAHHAPSEPTYP
jgi:serine/threonine-protein kinase HipA